MYDIYVHAQFLKTPEGNPLQAPTLALAKAIEEEWEKDPRPQYTQKPLTSLVATALDRITNTREAYVKHIIQVLSRDAILFWAETPPSLRKLQEEKWAPLIEEVNKTLDLSLKQTFSFSIEPLSPEEEESIRIFLNRQSVFKLSGFVHLLTLSSSFCLSYLVEQGRLSAEDAWKLAHLSEHDQRRVWGKDQEAILHEKTQRDEFLETARYLMLIK